MKSFKLLSSGILIFSFPALAALPPQFSDCLAGDSSTISVQDVKDIAKVAKVTYCQNQIGLTNKYDTLDMLKDKNIEIGISVAKTTYGREDLMDFAKAGSYVLYVDSSRIAREYLVDLAKAGVQLVVISSTSGLSISDLKDLAKAKNFALNVNSPILKEDLKSLVDAGVHVVIRSSQAGLSKEDIVDIAKVNSDLVSIKP